MGGRAPDSGASVPFGARDVGRAEKRALVRGVFDGVSGRYDLMNDLMSAGVHRRWKRLMVASVRSRDAAGPCLDLAGGTGDIAFRLKRRFRKAPVTVCDCSPEMVAEGRRRGWDRGWSSEVSWTCGDSAALPFPDRSFSLVTCAFGLRNFAELGASLREVRRVLRPGGRLLSLEFFPQEGLAGGLYRRYLDGVIPRLGEAVAGRRSAYAYLAESIGRFLPRERLEGELREAGLGQVRAEPRAFGIAVQHSARRA